MSGKVWLVGAGPGDVGLLTIRGREVLEQADVVVYDALVGQGVLGLIPENARLIFAGKRSGNHYLRQEQTNQVLLEEAQCIDGQTYMTGFNPQYVRCAVRLSDPPNTIVKGVVRGFLRDDLMLLVTDREA